MNCLKFQIIIIIIFYAKINQTGTDFVLVIKIWRKQKYAGDISFII